MTDKRTKIKNAVLIGSVCAIMYMVVFFTRNVLSAISPQLNDSNVASLEFLGTLSSVYFLTYGIGQLINGVLGERISSKFMVSAGLILAGISCFSFTYFISFKTVATVLYGCMGFFLSMIYCPLVKVASENVDPIYAVRVNTCCKLSSLLGSPLAGFIAVVLSWKNVLLFNTFALISIGVLCFSSFTLFERKKIIKAKSHTKSDVSLKGAKILFKREIVKFTVIAVLTGVIRTTVVFWMPTYFSDNLGFSARLADSVFSVGTLAVAFSAVLAIFFYEFIGYRRNLTLFIAFTLAAVFFLLMYVIKEPYANAVCMIGAVFCSNISSTILWSVYCTSLADTGYISTGTGFLDFASYMAAAVSSKLFANAVTDIGWNFLILIWVILMVAGIFVSFPLKDKKYR